jgi:muramoyltetrapeptide carboxypeptidase
VRVLRPPRLRRGDTIGIFTPSLPVPFERPRRFARAVAELERRGFSVVAAPHALRARGHVAGTVEERAGDLNGLFADDRVRGLMAAIGGFNSNSLLEALDYDLIAARPKVFVGYSDVTALHAAIWSRTRLAVTLGPALLPQLGEHGGADPYTWDSFARTLMRAEPAGRIEPAPAWTDERLAWDEADDRPRARRPNAGPRPVRAGSAEGVVVAGNLSTLLGLAGTCFFPALEGTLLFLEEDETEQLPQIDRLLTQLRLLGAFERAAGLALGRFQAGSAIPPAALDELLLRVTAGTSLPIAADLDFGHTDPMVCLPWGVRARLEVGSGVALELLEPAVS